MSYEIRVRRIAQKQLDTVRGKEYESIARVISALEQQPRPVKTKKLADSGLWRIRIGRYRIIYAIEDEAKQVIIVRIAKRTEDTYKKL